MNNDVSPPVFLKKFEYQSLKQINEGGKRVYETPNGDKVPSVTTILSKTKDMTHLNEWKQRVGEQVAQRIVKEASGIGSAMHNNLEKFLLGEQRVPGTNLVHVQANKMANQIIQNALVHVDEVWGIEQALYFPGLYSGTTDLVGQYKGNPAIMDFKQTNKPKKKEWIESYFMQCCAYSIMWEERTGRPIKQLVICIAGDQGPQVFIEDRDNWTSTLIDTINEYKRRKLFGR